MICVLARRAVVLTALLHFVLFANGQDKQDYTWLFNNRASGFNGLYVNTTFQFSEGSFYSFLDTVQFNSGRTNSSITDETGKLLFYTNGCQVIQADHSLMENGDSLNFGNFYTEWWDNCSGGYVGFQDIIILNDPKNINGYYIIHKTFNFITTPLTFYLEGLKYTYVDMTLNDGKGKVTVKNKTFFNKKDLVSSFLTAIRHQNTKDWWLIQMKENSNAYLKFIINENGPMPIDSQNIGPKTTRNTSAGGFAKFSPDGKQWAWFTTENGLNLFDFDGETGELSNQKLLMIPHRRVFTGLEFSPNSRFIYISAHDSLFQVDTWHSELIYELIDSFDKGEQGFANFHGISLAPDCKIYMTSSNSTKSLSRINYPNKKGKACDFRQHEVPLFATNGIGIPNFPRLRVDEIDVCDSTEQSTGVIDIVKNRALMRIYPNPVKDIAKIQSEESGNLYLFDMRGVMVKSLFIQKGSNYLDMQAMDNGFYFINFINNQGGHYGTKIFKTNSE